MDSIKKIIVLFLFLILSSCTKDWKFSESCSVYPRLLKSNSKKNYTVEDLSSGNTEMVLSCDL